MADDSAALGAGRVELPDLPRPSVCYADHSYPAFSATQMRDYARATLALADAEAADWVKGTDLWAEWESLRLDLELAVSAWAHDQSGPDEQVALKREGAIVDAFVRRIIAAAGTAGRDGDGGER